MSQKEIALIVAHPDDETLWAGGTIMNHADWNWYVVSLCRGSDKDRAPKFFKALKIFGAEGNMGNVDDGPEQLPLDENEIKDTILSLLNRKIYDLIITHDPAGEYTRHLRHEETSRAVIHLWNDRLLNANELWTFAYDDDGGAIPPRAKKSADIYFRLPESLWKKKYDIITGNYGFPEDGFEAKATTRDEAFCQFTKTTDAINWLKKGN